MALEELEDWLAATGALDAARSALARFDAGEVTVGEVIAGLARAAAVAERATLHHGWGWLQERRPPGVTDVGFEDRAC